MPSPPQRTLVTEPVWQLKILRQSWVLVFQMRVCMSLELLAISLSSPFWAIIGCQAMLVTNFLWPRRGCPICSPDSASQRYMTLSIPPLATILESGEKATNRTWSLCPSQVCRGHSVERSHRRIVASPAPLAKYLPSGLKAKSRTAPLWPSKVLDALVIGLILNIASGLKRTGMTVSPLYYSFLACASFSLLCWIRSRIS